MGDYVTLYYRLHNITGKLIQEAFKLKTDVLIYWDMFLSSDKQTSQLDAFSRKKSNIRATGKAADK